MSIYAEGTLKERVKKEIQDTHARLAVAKATEKLQNGRLNAAMEMGNWEEWRERGSAIRSHTIAHLDYYLEQFTSNVEKQGGNVYFAKDAEEALAYALNISKSVNGKHAVKSKSMVTEEIKLNEALNEIGVETVETDLGEYILQLAGEHPSHLLGPAVHKTKEQVAELFSKEGGKEIPPDLQELVGFARSAIREKFLQADIGITGCNFAIAEEGAVSLLTNEGNARMVTTLPDTHIVFMGMERIVPTWEDFEVVINLLPRAGTGQKISSGVSILKPVQPHENDGPKQMHVIILDNGRSKQLGDPDFQEILNCIRCGACINVCPVYRHVGGHSYGSVYNGPIGAVLTPLLNEDSKQASELSYASSLCGACHEACPVRIPLHDMLVKLRHRNVENGDVPALEKLAFNMYGKTFSSPALYNSATKAGLLMQKPFTKDGHFKESTPFMKGWTNSREFPEVQKSFRERWKESLAHQEGQHE
ncbi:L-lactate dehydrogenase complex protein LldF [Bacillus ectoiniformans]|uniref:LutB/LldF family L-lactate oxidation iron-sulfur protein n=1 Tax=Bacillus ectoiniformans TaxID=1494429 RepID=UPI001958C1DB|nr:LutB/LldF family L-lactate oxidation iron-sulfur protein [Bacillus ectoiniformans]MBM7649601.1 L-lactate dehydrogenase complex protein LldF [Bacillus ectoiniformans]